MYAIIVLHYFYRVDTVVRAHQDVAQVPLLPRHGVDVAQRRKRDATDRPLSLSQGFGRLSVEEASVPDRVQTDRVPILVRVFSAERKCSCSFYLI